MGRMKELLDQRLEENKYELYWSLKELIDKYWCNQEEDMSKGFIACITPDNIPDYWLKARRIIFRIEELPNVESKEGD